VKKKKVVAIGDLHCGHRYGLTPAEWRYDAETVEIGKKQKIYYDFYEETAKAIVKSNGGYVDCLILNGDAIDGKGSKSGGREQITTDRVEQVAMAVECIKLWRARQIAMTYGTPRHVGEEENWEDVLCKDLRKELGIPVSLSAHETVNVNGLIFDVKHKISNSTIPHGRYTASARTALWNKYWAERGQRPKADIVLRSHVHYYAITGDATFTAFILPGLQGLGTEYGARECEGIVDFGLVWFDVQDKNNWVFQKRLFDWGEMAATSVIV